MRKTVHFQSMGEGAAEVERKARLPHDTKHHICPERLAQYEDEACVECGVHGGFGDGRFNYCSDHLPEDYFADRDAAKAFTAKMKAEGTPWPPAV